MPAHLAKTKEKLVAELEKIQMGEIEIINWVDVFINENRILGYKYCSIEAMDRST